MTLTLKPFQETKAQQIVKALMAAIKSTVPTDLPASRILTHRTARRVLLTSPTGSGKTTMVAAALAELRAVMPKVLQIWLSPGAGKLPEQSAAALNRAGCTAEVLTSDSVGRFTQGFPDDRTLVASFESLVGTDKDGDFTQLLTRTQEGRNLWDLARATSLTPGTALVVTIDESHLNLGAEKTQNFLEALAAAIHPAPLVLLEATATRRFRLEHEQLSPLMSTGAWAELTVSRKDAVEAGLIKSSAHLNAGVADLMEALSPKELADLPGATLLLNSALDRLNALDTLYNKHRQHVGTERPLMLIQLADGPLGKRQLETVKGWLDAQFAAKRLTKAECAIWTSAEKSENVTRSVACAGSQVRVLVFKQAIATGWDCPRAHVLATFRDPKSKTFALQVLGRILRTPAARAIPDGLDPLNSLNTAFVYSNVTHPVWDKLADSETMVPLEDLPLQDVMLPDGTLLNVGDLRFTRQNMSRAGAFNDISVKRWSKARTALRQSPRFTDLGAALVTGTPYTESVSTGEVQMASDANATLRGSDTVALPVSVQQAMDRVDSRVHSLAVAHGLNSARVMEKAPRQIQGLIRDAAEAASSTPVRRDTLMLTLANDSVLDILVDLLNPLFKEARNEQVGRSSTSVQEQHDWHLPAVRHAAFGGTQVVQHAKHLYGRVPPNTYDSQVEEAVARVLAADPNTLGWAKNAVSGAEALTAVYTVSGEERETAPDYIIPVTPKPDGTLRVLMGEVKDSHDPRPEDTAAKVAAFPAASARQPTLTASGQPQEVIFCLMKPVPVGNGQTQLWVHPGGEMTLVAPTQDDAANRAGGWLPYREVAAGASLSPSGAVTP